MAEARQPLDPVFLTSRDQLRIVSLSSSSTPAFAGAGCRRLTDSSCLCPAAPARSRAALDGAQPEPSRASSIRSRRDVVFLPEPMPFERHDIMAATAPTAISELQLVPLASDKRGRAAE